MHAMQAQIIAKFTCNAKASTTTCDLIYLCTVHVLEDGRSDMSCFADLYFHIKFLHVKQVHMQAQANHAQSVP